MEKHLDTIFMEPFHEKAATLLQVTTQTNVHTNAQLTAFEAEGRRNDGATFPMELNLSAFSQDGQLFCLMMVRDVTEQKRARERTDVQYAVTRVLASSKRMGETLQELLDAIGKTLHCTLGFFWNVDKKHHILLCKELWHTMSVVIDTAELSQRQISLSSTTEIPGIAYVQKKPVWISDVSSGQDLSRSSIALKYQPPGALAFPIVSDNEILGVFEFFMHKKQPVDRHLLDCLNTLGDHIGQFFKRKEYEKVHIKMNLGSCKTDIRGIWHPFVCLFARDGLYQRVIKAGCKGSPEYYYNGVHGGSRPVLYFQHPRQRSSV